MRWLLPGLIGLLCCSSAFASGAGGLPLQTIAEGVYVHQGQHAGLDDPGRGDSANISFVMGTRCVAVIDSGGSIATGQQLKAAIKSITSLPVCYVINTHVHFDHVLGNAAFVDPANKFVGHTNLGDALPANRDFFAESFAAELGGEGHQASVIAPDILVENVKALDLGGRTLLLTAHPNAHSSTDLSVYDKTSDTLWTGDLLFRERMPIIDGSLKGWLGWLDSAMASNYAHVVPGHGPVDHQWPQGALAQQRYLKKILDGTRASIAAGEFLDEAKATVASDEQAQWLLTERAHGLNISRAYRELEWE